MLWLPQLSGSNPAAAKARAIQRDLEAKRKSREYEAYCKQQNIGPAEANLLAPKNVKRGAALRSIEAKRQRQQELKQRKERLERRFGSQRSAS